MSPKSSLSYSAAVILQAVTSGYRYGFDVMDVTGLPSGTVYPALRRMEHAGLVASTWEDDTAAQRDGRPARKYYEVTDEGREALAEAVRRYRRLERLLPATGADPEPSSGRA
jgi:PadR family transcriptional regulator PadR